RQRVIALTDAEEPTERHHRVGDLAGVLVDHDVVDRAQAVALLVVHRRALDLVGGDQSGGLALGELLVLRILVHVSASADNSLSGERALFRACSAAWKTAARVPTCWYHPGSTCSGGPRCAVPRGCSSVCCWSPVASARPQPRPRLPTSRPSASPMR